MTKFTYEQMIEHIALNLRTGKIGADVDSSEEKQVIVYTKFYQLEDGAYSDKPRGYTEQAEED